jgi:quinol-cytochrome oxidoreductase complex cytochrome b subunit
MSERIFLLLLVPHALLLVWAIRKLGFTSAATISLGVVTTATVWAILYASFAIDIFPQDAAEAFASVEHIMRDVDSGWLLRYLAEVYGWLFGAAFFCVCWCIARFMPDRKSEAQS